MAKDFTLADVAFLTSDRGTALLAELTTEDLSDKTLLNLIPRLRPRYSADETSAAIETVKLRRKAVDKFGDDAANMLFTRDALEQASDPQIRAWRAGIDTTSVVDVCCSIGTDTLAYARAGRTVTGVDIDPVRIGIARHNAQTLGLTAEFAIADVTAAPLPPGDMLFYDPARRDERGKRIHNVERYVPALSLVRRWERSYNPIIVKLSPGVDVAQLAQYHASLSFLSVAGDLKEAELGIAMFGAANTAVLFLPGDDTPHAYQCEGTAEAPFTDEPDGYLNEPDPAIIRAGYVQHLATELGGALLDPTIAYVTTPTRPDSVWVRSWRIQDWMPFNLKKLRAYLKQRNVGQVTVKKRGSPITPEELQAKLKLKGDNSATVVLTRLRGQQIVLICEDYTPK